MNPDRKRYTAKGMLSDEGAKAIIRMRMSGMPVAEIERITGKGKRFILALSTGQSRGHLLAEVERE